MQRIQRARAAVSFACNIWVYASSLSHSDVSSSPFRRAVNTPLPLRRSARARRVLFVQPDVYGASSVAAVVRNGSSYSFSAAALRQLKFIGSFGPMGRTS
ncbi:hypothetical protein ANN_02720 [Periplaneta americana]|uniref:Secreted protein n=1 Tax=Periplaneta americana TaxID=6978 RepID=A0ABQ8TX26_PERAM|nr:hypothetical protein ANN_02720 [Periplaneta americana]